LCGTDFGTQNSLFCSVETFRNLYKPFYAIINNWIHENTNWKTFKHSCGAIRPLIPELIEAGFDVLNPVQCSADGMDAADLKRSFGDHITFWGGGVDTQKTLPFGTPEQVREEVLSRCDIFSRGGGFVFNAVHNLQAQTPVDNLVAMFKAVQEFNGA
jgi:uroporphyrinogen-III decarboxylase